MIGSIWLMRWTLVRRIGTCTTLVFSLVVTACVLLRVVAYSSLVELRGAHGVNFCWRWMGNLTDQEETREVNHVLKFFHFGCTSEDKQSSTRLMLKDAVNSVILPVMNDLINAIYSMVKAHAHV
ncbi:putative L-Aspartase, fumarate lyase [Helianthus annuus]|nr:putative L-Aspartase, fumarate lyase [Helianthus annuus]